MNLFIAVIQFILVIFLFLLFMTTVSMLNNLFNSLIGKIIKTDMKIKHLHAAAFSEDRINADHVSYAALDNEGSQL